MTSEMIISQMWSSVTNCISANNCTQTDSDETN